MREELRAVIPMHRQRFWYRGDGFQCVKETPFREEQGSVGGDLEACADFLELADCFEDGDAVGGVCEFGGEGGAETGEAGADYDEVDAVVGHGCWVFCGCERNK